MAAGRQRAWALVQCICVVVSILLDPLLIPFFQRHSGNGGLGICVSTVVSECTMLLGALLLLPSGVLTGAIVRPFLTALGAGAAMAVVARALHGISSLAVAPLCAGVYVACLLAPRSVRQDVLGVVKRVVGRRIGT
jgi:hypothetical protein